MSSSRIPQGILLMTLAMLSIPIVDGIAKYLSASYSPLFLGWARYAVASSSVVPISAAVRRGRVFPAERRLSHILRTTFLVAAMTLYFVAIARVPLATAASAFFVGPIVAVVLSVVLLGERMTARKAFALVLGAVGCAVILQPAGGMDPGIVLAFGAGVLFALYLITTRHAAQASEPLPTLAFQCVAGMVLLTPQAIASWRTPDVGDVPWFLALGGVSALSHILSIAAFRFADASTLAPLVYIELIGAALIGYAAFDEVPSIATVVGAVLIIAGGLVLLRPEMAKWRNGETGIAKLEMANRDPNSDEATS